MTNPVEDQSPAEALEAVRQSRRATVAQVGQGSWLYDLMYAASVAGMVASQAAPQPFGMLGTVACTLAMVLMMRLWSNHTGVKVNGLMPGRARWVGIGHGLVMAVTLIAMLYATREHGLWRLPLFVAPVAGLVALAGSRLWWKVYRDETAGRGL